MATKSNSGFGKFFLGLILGALLIVGAAWLYLRFGHLPVAVADTPWPYERQITHTALNARIAHEKTAAPFSTSEDVFESGAHIYRNNCASCHGVPNHPVAFAKNMYPAAPQLWAPRHRGNKTVVGVSHDDPGAIDWIAAHGIRLSGMPSFAPTLTDTQIWQVTLLLKNADQPLPDPVTKILTTP